MLSESGKSDGEHVQESHELLLWHRISVYVCVNYQTCVYLKLGAEAHSRARQAKSTAAYTSRKKMVTMLAMVLSFPENRTS